MYTDMVGYTALGQRNESLSLALVEEQRKLIRPILSRHTGREVKTMGDAFLVEFPSALEAVRCAYDVQRATKEFNMTMPSEKGIHLRVGIHLGDVVDSQGDISGDAVNVASRIEQFADDGGVCLTRQVYESVRGKFEPEMQSLGPKSLKNVEEPLEVFRISMPWLIQGIERSSAQLDRRRVAILPFRNMSPDPNDEYFAEGMTEELITTLSKIGKLIVIARTSVMQYKNTIKRISDISKELGAGTLIEGSVRKSGNRVRITVQLLDSMTEGHVWAENYDKQLDDVFAIQSEIAEKVAKELRVQLVESDKEKLEKIPTTSTEAYVLYLKGRYFWNERTRDGISKAIRYFEEAVNRDERYALAYTGLADCYYILQNWAYAKPSEVLPKAKEYADKALLLEETLAEAHVSLAHILTCNWEIEQAARELRRAIQLNPNYARAHQFYGNLICKPRGDFEEALTAIEEAERLDPLSPMIGANKGDILLAAGRYTAAAQKYSEVIQANPEFFYAHMMLGEALVATGSFEEGIAAIKRSLEISPGNPVLLSRLASSYAVAGRTDEATDQLGELKQISELRFVPSSLVAEVYSSLRQPDIAFLWLDKALGEHGNSIVQDIRDPPFDAIRSDPRFLTLIRRLGLL